MSEERQLTVAEILARAQQDNPEAGARRRRRRSLEEGGVSVAELTGSLKKVEARPVEARHSSVPLDAPEKPRSAAPGASTSTRVVFPERVKPAADAAPAAEAPAAEAPAAVAADTAAAGAPAAPAEPERKTEVGPSEEETASIKKVVAPEPARAAAPAAAPAPVPAEAPVERTERAETEVFAAQPAPAEPAAVETTSAEPVYAHDVEGHEGEGFDPFAENFDEMGEVDHVPADEIEVEEATVNPIVLVLLVFLGVVLGVAGFLLFKWVWANTSTVVAALLAAAAVAAVVLGAGARRSGRDALTMTLAGLAAAVAAFGPSLL